MLNCDNNHDYTPILLFKDLIGNLTTLLIIQAITEMYKIFWTQ